jgi:hypothetical protein
MSPFSTLLARKPAHMGEMGPLLIFRANELDGNGPDTGPVARKTQQLKFALFAPTQSI